MSYLYNLPNSTSADTILVETTQTVPAFTPLLLLFIFFLVFIGGITRQKIKTGTADYPAWGIIASISILIPSLILSINYGYIRLDWLVIIISLNIMAGIWFFLDRKITEV